MENSQVERTNSVAEHRDSARRDSTSSNYRARRVSYPNDLRTPRNFANETRRRSSARNRMPQTDASAICRTYPMAVGVLAVCAVGLGVGIYCGVYFTAKGGENLNTDKTDNTKEDNFIAVETQSEDNYEEFFWEEPAPVMPNGGVWLNSATCGTLGAGVSNPLFPNRKRREIYDLPIPAKIVGGEETNINQHPWQVSLWTTYHACGGSIIASNWILFAAHCAQSVPRAGDWTAYAGVSVRSLMTQIAQRSKGKDLIFDPLFDTKTYDEDIALLRLENHFQFTNDVRPVCLPPANYPLTASALCQISGWGVTIEGGELPDTLQWAPVEIVPNRFCNMEDWHDGMITENMICAGTIDGSRDACQGDSGGPLTCYDAEAQKFLLVGAVSWGIGCGVRFMPGVYTDVSKFISWITEHMTETEAKY